MTEPDHVVAIIGAGPGGIAAGASRRPDLLSDIVIWLAGDASTLITAAQIPADKGYLKT